MARFTRIFAGLLTALLSVLMLAVAPAAAQEGQPTAAVSLGDSFISGEGGRWQGNWATAEGDRGGTDRAAKWKHWRWTYNANRVYGQTNVDGCHRSDVAEIHSANLAVDTRINLACSGAVSANVFRSSNGGQSQNGYAPQADQLASVAATHNVELIALSIGGNDLGFGAALTDCILGYNTSTWWWKNTCNEDQQANIDDRMPAAMAGVAKAIDEIRAVMSDAGQGPDSYRLVVQSYASPIPRGADFRYSESGWARTNTGGCPFWNVDATWARDSLVPQISSEIGAVAAAKGAEFLDLSNAFEGREICSTSTAHGAGANAEWARFLSLGVTQGEVQESIHPNAFGQQAQGTCLGLLAAAASGSYSCNNVAGQGPGVMTLNAS